MSKEGSPTIIPSEVIRATEAEKESQIHTVENIKKSNPEALATRLISLQNAAIKNQNLFEELMETSKVCSLGQITNALYEVGGKYRRNM